jgi:hypothetical protein
MVTKTTSEYAAITVPSIKFPLPQANEPEWINITTGLGLASGPEKKCNQDIFS